MLTISQARDFLILLKKDYGITYREQSKILECSENHLYHITIGDRKMSRKMIAKLEKFLIENNIII